MAWTGATYIRFYYNGIRINQDSFDADGENGDEIDLMTQVGYIPDTFRCFIDRTAGTTLDCLAHIEGSHDNTNWTKVIKFLRAVNKQPMQIIENWGFRYIRATVTTVGSGNTLKFKMFGNGERI